MKVTLIELWRSSRESLIHKLGGVPIKFCELWGERMYRKGLKEGMQPLGQAFKYPNVEKVENPFPEDKYW